MNGKNIFLQKLKEKSNVEKASNLGKPSAYKVDNLEYIYLRYSKKHVYGKRHIYWYGVEKEFLIKLVDVRGFVVFITENPTNNFKIPAKYLLELLKDKPPASDGNWKIHLFETGTSFEFRIAGEGIDLSAYLNLYRINRNERRSPRKPAATVEKDRNIAFDNLNIQNQIKILRKNQLDILKKIGLIDTTNNSRMT